MGWIERENDDGTHARTHFTLSPLSTTQPTHGNIIRLAPPLCISEGEVLGAADLIVEVIESFD